MAKFLQKGLYMKNNDKVDRSNDKKQRIVCKRKNLENYFGKFLLCKDNQIIFDETMASHYLVEFGGHWQFGI